MENKKESYGLNGLVVKSWSVLKPLTRFNLEERRLFDFCIQHYDSRKDATNPRYFDISVEDFKKAFPEYQRRKPNQIFHFCKIAINGIQQKPFEPKEGEAEWWFTSLKITDETIRFGLNPYVMPFFLELQKHFIKYHMNDVRFLNKPLAWSLYEYLKEKFLGGKCPEWVVEIIDLKDRLGVTNKYTRFSNFDNLCLKRPQTDINKYTDLKFEYKKIKKGRTVVKIRFIVIQKSLSPDVIDTEDLGKIFARELSLAGINKTIADKFVQAAADRNLTSTMLEKLPKIKKSWKKNGGKPYSAYLSGVLHKELLELPLKGFESTGHADFSAYSAEELKKFLKHPGYRKDVRAEIKRRGLPE